MAQISIFQDGKLKEGVYKIQNIYTETYLDFHLHSMKLCCRPLKDLEDKRGLWKIGKLGNGYALWRFDPGNRAYQFCSPMQGLNDWDPVCVTAYPTGWRVERAKDEIYRQYEYVRFHLGPTRRTWDLGAGNKDNGAPVIFFDSTGNPWQVWRLIPVEVEDVNTPVLPPRETFGFDLLFPHDGNEPVQVQDDLGTVVTEVTVVTTRKRYRVEP